MKTLAEKITLDYSWDTAYPVNSPGTPPTKTKVLELRVDGVKVDSTSRESDWLEPVEWARRTLLDAQRRAQAYAVEKQREADELTDAYDRLLKAQPAPKAAVV